ncbi:hypothetical protein B0H15DRAFT_870437 [Mycena belliarum]|uniref:Uncharacterized protein n=1 Tax=Mycena belliarum TaxID=1033014 RepID=A0AAD6XLE7_9AGAR|nr:hypothetical protein B0H15DRAFT_870437 [Mycena belliae]
MGSAEVRPPFSLPLGRRAMSAAFVLLGPASTLRGLMMGSASLFWTWAVALLPPVGLGCPDEVRVHGLGSSACTISSGSRVENRAIERTSSLTGTSAEGSTASRCTIAASTSPSSFTSSSTTSTPATVASAAWLASVPVCSTDTTATSSSPAPSCP